MNILVVSHMLSYPPHGGAVQRMYYLLRQLAQSHTVDLVTFSQKKLCPTREAAAKAHAHLSGFCRSVKIHDVPTDYSKLGWYSLLATNLLSLKPYSSWRFHSAEMTNSIRQLLATHSYDLVQFDTIALAQYQKLVGDIPSVLVHQNVESTLLIRRSRNERSAAARAYIHNQGQKLRRYEQEVAGKFAVNITVSELDKIELAQLAPTARIEVVDNGTDVEYFKPLDLEQQPRVVFTGGMTWYPNRDAMIWFCQEIYPILKGKCPEMEADIIGRVPPPEVKQVAQADPSVHAHGFVDDIRTYVGQAAVYIVPIRVGGGTRLKILDAMASGKAIVSTTIGAEGLEVKNGEHLLIADSAEEFSEAIRYLIQNPAARRKLEVNARLLAEQRYAWSVIGAKQESIYRSVVHGKPAAAHI